jgi:DNA-binding NarL/FixJ family response regulator
VDVQIPKIGGLELVKRFRDMRPSAFCLMLTMSSDESTFNAAMDAGARGYVLKDNAVELAGLGLKVVAAGGLYICPGASRFLLRRQERVSALKLEKTGLASVTPTERRILRLVSENKTNKEIADALFLSPRTVETHRTNLCRKLELHGSNKLLQFAIEHRSELS